MGTFDNLFSAAPTATQVATPTTASSNGGTFANLFSSSTPQSSPIVNHNSPVVATQNWNGQQIPANIVTKNLVSYDPQTGNKTFKLPTNNAINGGVYTEDAKGNIVNTGHTTYGGEPAVKGQERDDIIPVSLGGANSNAGNIQMVPFPAAGAQDKAETTMASLVKTGQVQPKAAIPQILSQKEQIANKPTLLQSILNAPNTFGQDLTQGFVSAVNSVSKKDTSGPMVFPVQKNTPAAATVLKRINQGQNDQAVRQEQGANAMSPIDAQTQIPRMVAALAISGYQMFQDQAENQANLQNRIEGKPEIPHTDVGHSVEPSTMSPTMQALLGTDTIKDLPGQAADLEQNLNQAGIKGNTAAILASLGVSANTVATLYPVAQGLGLGAAANDAIDSLANNFTKDTGVTITRSDMFQISRGDPENVVSPEVKQAWTNYVNKAAAAKLAAVDGSTTIPSGESPETPISTALRNASSKDIFGGQPYTPNATINENGFPTQSPLTETPPTETPTEPQALTTSQSQLSTINEKGFPTSSPIVPQAQPQTQITPKTVPETASYRSAHQVDLSSVKPASSLDVGAIKEKIREVNGYINNTTLSDLKKLEKLQGNPDAEVTIYRASPKNELNSGDWVTTNKDYANNIKQQNGGKVFTYKVKASDLKYPNDISTLPSMARASAFSYSPETAITPKPAETPTQPVKPEIPAVESKPTVQGQTPSKIAQSIEQKAVEANLTKGFEGVAGYDKITIKDQAEKATKLMSDPVKAMSVIRGETPLPDGLRGTALITAAEEYIKNTGDVKMAYELANSPLTSATSAAAQEMRLAAERTPDNATAKLQEIRNAKIAKAGGEKAVAARKTIIVKQLKEATTKVNLTKEELSWDKFLETITC